MAIPLIDVPVQVSNIQAVLNWLIGAFNQELAALPAPPQNGGAAREPIVPWGHEPAVEPAPPHPLPEQPPATQLPAEPPEHEMTRRQERQQERQERRDR